MFLAYPKRIVCEWGARKRLDEIFKEMDIDEKPKYLLVTGRSIRYDIVKNELTEKIGEPIIHFNRVTPEPCIDDLETLIKILRERKPELILAVGGGSVIDVAKACAAIAPAKGACKDYFYAKRQIKKQGITLVAMPTTAGTGAEITKNSVILDPKTKLKQSIRHRFMIPAVAICDPELTVSMPRNLTIDTGLDAMTQAIEAYLTKSANHLTRALAMKAVQLILTNLPIVVENPNDRMARIAMCEGSLLSAMSFSQSGLGAVHGLAHPIGALLNVPHGRCCAILLPHVMAFNAPACSRRLNELAGATQLNDADDFTQCITELCSKLGVQHNFMDFGLKKEHFHFIVKNCRSNSMSGNPVYPTDEDIVEILEKLS